MPVGRLTSAVVFGSVGLAILALAASPARAEGRRNWQLDVSGAKLGSVPLTRKSGAREVQWYFLFRIENHTGADRALPILVRGTSDESRTVVEGVYPEAEKVLEAKLGAPRLSLGERPSVIKDGEGLDCVALLGPVDPEADRLDIQITGLHEPVIREKGKEIHERKAYQLSFGRWGDEFLITFDLIEPLDQKWVVLEEPKPLPHAATPKSE